MEKWKIYLCFLLILIVLSSGLVKAYTPTEAQERAAQSLSKTLVSDPNAYTPPILQGLGGQTAIQIGLAQTSRPSPIQQLSQTDHPHQVFNRDDAEVHTHLKRGTVFVRPKTKKTTLMVKRSLEDPNDGTLDYLAAYPEIFKLAEPGNQLNLRTCRIDELGMMHLAYQQHANGIPIWGKQLVSHFDSTGKLNSINCLVEPAQTNLETRPVVTEQEAVEIAHAALSQAGQAIILPPEKMETLGLATTATLYYWNKGLQQKLELVWVVDVHPNLVDWQRFFIQAGDGSILETYNAAVSDGPATAQAVNLAGQTVAINTYQIGSTYYLIDGSEPMFVSSQSSSQLINNPQGVIYVVNANNHDLTSSTALSHFTSSANTWSDTSSVSAQDYMRQTYNFHKNTLPAEYAWNSFDNQGSTMMSVLHVTESSQKMDNAYWNGSFVVLGDGLTYFKPLAGGLDVLAHEFTHAVVQYTANLEYQYQSGALNETYADIGGVSVDTANYTLGESIVKSLTYFPTGALRDMANPHNGGSSLNDICWQPATMSEYQNMSLNDDNGGVHVNGGITNFAAYKIFNALGRTKGEQILYRALFDYLTSQSNFTDFRLAAVQAAADIYGESSAEQNAVKLAFDAVGIAEGTGTTPPVDNPVVSGDQYIIGANDRFPDNRALIISNSFSDIGDLNSLYYLPQHPPHIQVNTGSGRPISVDRYGNYIYLVDSQYNLRRIKPDGSDEAVISYATPQWGWWSVAVSPSGNHLALTKTTNENNIWVYDLTQSPPSSKQLILKHPTTDQNNTYDDIVDYADTMVFLDEHTIAYDCHNTIQSPGSGTISFWDVNVINTETEIILPVVPPQPYGVNVGNPTVASTNSSVLCVELANDSQQTNKVTGVNLATGEVATIFDNGTSLAYPHYSSDDRQMVFTRSTASGTNNVYRIDLAADKIHASGSPVQIITGMQLPYWFVVGTEPVVTITVAFDSASSSGGEADSTFSIPVTLSQAGADTITVHYAATGGTASAGTDYTLTTSTLTFPPGVTTQNITGTINNHHLDIDKTIIITLSQPVNASLGDTYVHTFTILSAGDASPYQLTTSIQGGHAAISPSSGGYPKDTVVTLTVTPESGYWVKAWHNSDDDLSRADSSTVTMNADKTITVEIASIITPKICTVKAGANNNDSLTFSGALFAAADQLNSATTCDVKIWSTDALIYQESVQASLFKINNGNYSYKHIQTKNDPLEITSLGLNLPKNLFSLKLRHADLTGMSSPIYIDVVMGDYSGLAEVGEDIINRSGPIPMQLLLGYEDALRIDNAKVTNSSLTIKGAVAVQNTSVDLSQYPMSVTWGAQEFVIPQNGFKKSGSRFIYKDPHGDNGSVSWAAFDLVHCTFHVTIKNTDITARSGSMIAGIKFNAFDQTDNYTLN